MGMWGMRRLVWWWGLVSSGCTGGRRVGWNANRWPMAIHNGVRRRPSERWRHALAVAFHFVPQHFDIPAHFLMALLEIDNEVDSYEPDSETDGGGLSCKSAYLC